MKTKVLNGAMLSLMAATLIAPLAYAQEDVIPVKTTEVAVADTVAPVDVQNVKATAGDGSVTLSWNMATDNVAVTGYKIYYGTTSVSEDGAKYDLGPIDAGNKITYKVTGLANGTPYFFAVTAYDDAKNESENYSAEVTGTPAHGAADTEAPKAVKAEAVNNVTVKVTFSEAVYLPAESPESAFGIKNDATSVNLEVKDAGIDATDETGKTVELTTATQEAGANYIVTAGIQVKDLADNGIVSGTSDTTLFTGSANEPAVTQESTQTEAADTVGPKLVNVMAPSLTTVTVKFDEAVKLGSTPTENFFITEEENTDKTLEITSADLSADEMTVTLTTAVQKTMNYNLIVLDVTDKSGNLVDIDNNATVFFGGLPSGTQETTETMETQAGEDVTAPEDATNLMVKALEKMMARLSWVASLNSAGDLADYVLYKSNDGITYGPGVALEMAATTVDVADLVPGMKYFFRLTARDTAGNESQGVVAMLTLPATGPELGLLALGSLGLGKVFKRRPLRSVDRKAKSRK
jgi:hypothetical protein